jgi:hypothetical protein
MIYCTLLKFASYNKYNINKIRRRNMTEIIFQYILILILVVGLAFLLYNLKEKGVIRDNDYYGITYTILGSLDNYEASSHSVKKILRTVASSVQEVENNYKNESYEVKEELALSAAKKRISALNLNSQLDEKSIRYMIRLACALQAPLEKIDGEQQ